MDKNDEFTQNDSAYMEHNLSGVFANLGLLDYINSLSKKEQDKYTEKYHFVDSQIGFVGGWPQILQTSYLKDDETQLIQLNSVEKEFVWGDFGKIQFYMKENDLKNLKFDDVKINLETT